MPQLVAFRRRWAIGSDDFVYPGLGEILLRLIWLLVISLIFHLHKDTFSCDTGHLLKAYYIGFIMLLVFNIIMTGIIVYTSAQGTITNDTPRQKLAKMIYIKFAITLPELAWNIIGAYWAFGMSSGCEEHIVMTVKGAVISGWVIGFIVVIGIAVIFDPLGALHTKQLSGSDSHTSDISAKDSAKRVWETRCKILCCCIWCDQQSTEAFSGIAEIFSNFFQGVDLVPTDVACGLILVQREQEEEKYRLAAVRVDPSPERESAVSLETPSTSRIQYSATENRPVDKPLPAPKPWMTIKEMNHYMKFAMGSYGWPLYIYDHLVTGTCLLWSQCKCCSCMLTRGDIRDDNCCMCNMAAIKKTTGVAADDVVYASFHNKIYKVPFFVSIDRKHQSVVVSIRGTLSFRDLITDLTAESESLDIDGLDNCIAHKGILQAAKYVLASLEKLHLLDQAFDRAQGARLVITGHSLGAGVAALLAILLKPKYPNLVCFAFSPPGGLMSLCASQYCQDFVCSVVLGEDLIPRLGIHTMEEFKTHILQAIQDCDWPKYKLLASGVWQLFCGIKLSHLHDHNQTRQKRPLLTSQHSSQYNTYQQDNVEPVGLANALHEAVHHNEQVKITYPQMYPPGQVLHIKEVKQKQTCCGMPEYYTVWAHPEDFHQLLVSPKMMSDHFPDVVMKALEQLVDNSHNRTSCKSSTVIQV